MLIFISIHAAREGGDAAVLVNVHAGDEISIHAAREGGDASDTYQADQSKPFQSTPPVKAATVRSLGIERMYSFQSTPPVKAATSRRSYKEF